MQFKITVFLSLTIIIGLLWWSSSQYDKGYQAGKDSEAARCFKDINAQAQALQSAMHQARAESRRRLGELEQQRNAEREKLNRRIRELLQTNAEYKKYYDTTAPPAVLDSIYGVR
jgi:hypothetical protein